MTAALYSIVPGEPNYSRMAHAIAWNKQEDDRLWATIFQRQERKEEEKAAAKSAKKAQKQARRERNAAEWAARSRDRRPDDAAPAAGGIADLKLVNPQSLAGLPTVFLDWLVENWLPPGVTALYGPGGSGKSLLAMGLMVAIATGKTFAGLPVKRGNVMGIFCEDTAEELHRRLVAVAAAHEVELADLTGMFYVSRVGLDNLLGTFDRENRFTLSPFYHQIEAAAISSGTKLIILDTAADLFAGNENDRGHVRQFVSALNRLALAIGGAVLLLAHPSRSGMSADGDMDGGSTAWSNSVRSRWALTTPKDAPADTPDRILSLRKSNYSAKGGEIRLRWQAGAFMPPAPGGIADALAAVNRELEADGVFLALLDRFTATGKRLSDSKNAANFAPKMLAASADAKGFRRQEFTRAMDRLFAAGTLKLGAYGRKGDARQMIVRADAAQAGEA